MRDELDARHNTLIEGHHRRSSGARAWCRRESMFMDGRNHGVNNEVAMMADSATASRVTDFARGLRRPD